MSREDLEYFPNVLYPKPFKLLVSIFSIISKSIFLIESLNLDFMLYL